MFPFLRRKKKKTHRHGLECKRHLYRAPVESEHIQAELAREGSSTVDVKVVDLSLEGIGIELPFKLDTVYEQDEVVSLKIRHLLDNWSVETAARVIELHEDGTKRTYCGLTFLNTGSLYAQLEDKLGRYFNRRRHERVRPELDQDVIVRVGQAGHRVRGPVHDLSQSGLCVALDLVSGAVIDMNKPIELSFDLPGCKRTFEGQGRTIARRRLAIREFLSVEFDFEAGGSLVDLRDDLVKYVEKRSTQMAAFSAALMSDPE